MESFEADFRSFGRVFPERAERLIALTREFDFRYTVHRVVSLNLTDPAVYRYQIDAAKALRLRRRQRRLAI